MPIPEPSKKFFECLPLETLARTDERPVEYLNAADFGGEDPRDFLGLGNRRREEINGPCDFRSERRIGDPPRDPRKCSFEERLIEPDQDVFAIGVYSAERRGLLPDPDFINRPFVIEAGGAEEMAGKGLSS